MSLHCCSPCELPLTMHDSGTLRSSRHARRMAASFGSGFMYSLVSGSPNPLQAAITTGMAFAVFNGLFYQARDVCCMPDLGI